jgi:hypothetical protein
LEESNGLGSAKRADSGNEIGSDYIPKMGQNHYRYWFGSDTALFGSLSASYRIVFSWLICVMARLQSCHICPIPIRALAATDLQTTENKYMQGLKPSIFLLNWRHEQSRALTLLAISMEFCTLSFRTAV